MSPDKPASDNNKDVAPKSVLGRAFVILDEFDDTTSELTLGQLSRRTAIPKTTVHRIAGDLVDIRMLERTDTGYRLGLRLFELGTLVPAQRQLRDVALPFIEELFERTRLTVHLAVLDGVDVLYFVKIVGHLGVPLPSRTGGRMPAHTTALGKAQLAHSSRALVRRVIETGLPPRTVHTITAPQSLVDQLIAVREQGVAYEHEESVIGNSCVASPILDGIGRPLGAVSVSGHSVRLHPQALAPLVRLAARRISGRLEEVGGQDARPRN